MQQSKIILLVIVLVMLLALVGIVQAMYLKTQRSHDPKNGHLPLTELNPLTFYSSLESNHYGINNFSTSSGNAPTPEYYFVYGNNSDNHPLALIFAPAPEGVHHLTNNETIPPYVSKLASYDLLREGTTNNGGSNAASGHANETSSLRSLNGSNKSREKYYNDSVLNDQLVHTPINPSLILFGSGLIALRIFQRRLHG
jgi:hypothetical protein